MKAFIVKEGTEVTAVKFSGIMKMPKLEKKVIKKETMYFIEDIAVDPIGKAGAGPNHHSIGGQWANKGFYGFKLPENKSGYELMLVHGYDIEIG